MKEAGITACFGCRNFSPAVKNGREWDLCLWDGEPCGHPSVCDVKDEGEIVRCNLCKHHIVLQDGAVVCAAPSWYLTSKDKGNICPSFRKHDSTGDTFNYGYFEKRGDEWVYKTAVYERKRDKEELPQEGEMKYPREESECGMCVMCGGEARRNSNYCGPCWDTKRPSVTRVGDARLPDECKSCGNPIDPANAVFCGYCGVRVVSEEPRRWCTECKWYSERDCNYAVWPGTGRPVTERICERPDSTTGVSCSRPIIGERSDAKKKWYKIFTRQKDNGRCGKAGRFWERKEC